MVLTGRLCDQTFGRPPTILRKGVYSLGPTVNLNDNTLWI